MFYKNNNLAVMRNTRSWKTKRQFYTCGACRVKHGREASAGLWIEGLQLGGDRNWDSTGTPAVSEQQSREDSAQTIRSTVTGASPGSSVSFLDSPSTSACKFHSRQNHHKNDGSFGHRDERVYGGLGQEGCCGEPPVDCGHSPAKPLQRQN